MMTRGLLVLTLWLTLTATAAAESAMIAGKVTWLSGSTVTVAVPVTQFGQRGSVTLDLSDVPQSDVSYIRSGDQVVIYGQLIDGKFYATRVVRR